MLACLSKKMPGVILKQHKTRITAKNNQILTEDVKNVLTASFRRVNESFFFNRVKGFLNNFLALYLLKNKYYY